MDIKMLEDIINFLHYDVKKYLIKDLNLKKYEDKIDIVYYTYDVEEHKGEFGSTFIPFDYDKDSFELRLFLKHIWDDLNVDKVRVYILKVIETFAHEFRHIYQKIHMPEISLDFEEPEDYDKYIDHPSERDANSYGFKIVKIYSKRGFKLG